MIESMYGASVFYEEAVNIALPDAYGTAVKEQELKVVGYPEAVSPPDGLLLSAAAAGGGLFFLLHRCGQGLGELVRTLRLLLKRPIKNSAAASVCPASVPGRPPAR